MAGRLLTETDTDKEQEEEYSDTTAAMEMDILSSAMSPPEVTSPGLVLLYSPSYTRCAPAYILTGNDLLIGRESNCDICIPDASVSRHHARIRLRDRRYVVTDLGGRNGTLVDGRFVAEAELAPHQSIRVGNAVFKLALSGAEGYARFRIDGAVLGGLSGDDAARRARSGDIVGGYQIDRLVRATERAAKSAITVMLLGESGSGKEVFARLVHAASGRRGPFVALNCAAVPEALLESELFGYKRGAFSGAERDKLGLFHAARGGTLLLDEIGDMPLAAQAKVLRVLQSKEVTPLGGTLPERVDVRVICATHRDLPDFVRAGRFRGDLYSRLNEFRVTLPPLRERKEDIFALVRAALARLDRPDIGVSPAFMLGLLHYNFPFNVRELEGFVKRAVALADDPALDGRHLPDEIREIMTTYGRRETADADTVALRSSGPDGDMSEGAFRSLLAREKGNISSVSRELGKDRTQIRRWLRRFGIDAADYR